MKIGQSEPIYIDVFSEDVSEISKTTKGGILLQIEGKFILESLMPQRDYHQVKIYLTRSQCKELRKLIRIKE
jgi:23S rRNA G2445 N2-methylase RlmL